MNILSYLKKLDWILIISIFSLIAFGLLSIYNSSIGREDFTNFWKQIVFVVLGFALMLVFSFFDWRIFRANSYLILTLYFLTILALAGLFFFAPEIRNVKSWYKIGPISIDPIEPTKLILIILLAKYFSMRHVELYRIRHILLSGLYIGLPAFLIFLQPDLGSVLIIVLIWLGLLVISGIKIRHFLLLMLAALLIFSLGWSFLLKDYQKNRIISFISPTLTEPLEAGWSQNQSKVAIGSGGFFGKGIGKGTQTQYGFLPEPQTDFIFSALAEEMGFLGVGILLILFSIVIWRIFKQALVSETNFPRLFASGLAILLGIQVFINIGMNLGILPIIGISLPLVSYGGSGLIFTFIGLGILQSIKIH